MDWKEGAGMGESSGEGKKGSSLGIEYMKIKYGWTFLKCTHIWRQSK